MFCGFFVCSADMHYCRTGMFAVEDFAYYANMSNFRGLGESFDTCIVNFIFMMDHNCKIS